VSATTTAPGTPRSQAGFALPVLLVLAAAFYAAFIARTSFRAEGLPFFTLIDDAMISMRYAQHLAAGQGLVWNVGEPPIQGFTNLGWVLLMSAVHLLRLPGNSISLAVMSISATILAANALVSHRICLSILPTARIAPLLAATITAFYFPLVFWSLRGMEVGLLVLLVSLAVLAALEREGTSRSVAVGLLLSVALLVRLDAAVQALFILGYMVAFKRSGRNAAWLSALIVGLTFAGILLFQQTYFGQALPNTYYHKMTGGDLVDRLGHGGLVFLQYALRDVIVLALVAAVGMLRYRQLRSPEALLLAGLFTVQCVYSVWVGGDYAEPEVASANRFIAQGVPALIVLFALVLDRLLDAIAHAGAHTNAWLVALIAGLAALLAASGMPWYRWAEDNAPLLRSDIRRVRAGLAIAGHTSQDAVIATHAAGQIPYFSGRRTIDLLGLNDPVIAHGSRRTSFYPGHDKWDYEHSIGELQPDLIADNWIRLADYIGTRSEYQQLENGMYIRIGTVRVDQAGLEVAFP
jgi:hypothetical protein